MQQLAVFERPTEIQRQLKEEFGVEVTLPALSFYNPDNPKLGQKWKDVFAEARAKFLAETEKIAIANKAFRLRELDRMYARQANAKVANPVEVRAILEQAAKEAGDGYSNRRELVGKGGKPLMPEGPAVVLYLPDNGRGDADQIPTELKPNAENSTD